MLNSTQYTYFLLRGPEAEVQSSVFKGIIMMKSKDSHIQRMYAKVWFLNKLYFEVFMAVTSQLSEGTTVYFPLQPEIRESSDPTATFPSFV